MNPPRLKHNVMCPKGSQCTATMRDSAQFPCAHCVKPCTCTAAMPRTVPEQRVYPNGRAPQAYLDLSAYRAAVLRHELAKQPFDDLDAMRREVAEDQEERAGDRLTQRLQTYDTIVARLTRALQAVQEAAARGHGMAALADLMRELHGIATDLQAMDPPCSKFPRMEG